MNHFDCAGFNLGVVDCVNDGDFNRLGVGGQLQRVVGKVDKFPVENTETFHAVSRKVVEEFIYQKFLRRRAGDCPERFIKALIQFKNIVAKIIFKEREKFFVGNDGKGFECFFRDKKSVGEIFLIVQNLRRVNFSFDMWYGSKQAQRGADEVKNFISSFHGETSLTQTRTVRNRPCSIGGK